MSSVRLSDTWRTTTFRLTLLYGTMFAVGVVVLLALIYYNTARYIDQNIDQLLKAELHGYLVTPVADLPRSIANDIERDARHIEIYGLFAPDGRVLAGNIQKIPPGIPSDFLPHSVRVDSSVVGGGRSVSIRALIAPLPDGKSLVVGREERQLEEIQRIIIEALIGGGGIILIGTLLGIWLSVVPIRRINEMQKISQQIINGEIGLRLPLAGRNDELDMLAQIVNGMLDEIEQRMRDIKGASDSIAHNLRTPLTRLRVMLNRLLQVEAGTDRAVVDQAIQEADQLLHRFRALLRISEISGSMRRAAFEKVDLKLILQNILDVFSPLAEEKNISLSLVLPDAPQEIFGDAALLFEAILNIVDNAIKFTQSGGEVRISMVEGPSGPRIDVVDNGIGIPAGDIDMVMKSFYRSDASRCLPGSGVGLSIVGAIVSLHGFHLEVSSGEGTTRFSLNCFR